MRRYAVLATTAGEVANFGADAALDKFVGRPTEAGGGAAVHRLVRLWFVTFPIAAASTFAAHELGHVSRAHEANTSTGDLNVHRWPWPLPLFSATLQRDSSFDELSIIAGGAEAAAVQAESLVDRIYLSSSADYFDWILLTYAKLEMPTYTWASRLSNPDAKPFKGFGGDVRDYAHEFATLRALARLQPAPSGIVDVFPEREYPAIATSIERGMWLNLMDYPFLVGVIKTLQYVAKGDRVTTNSMLKIGPLRVVPGARYTLTSLGPEKAITARLIGARRVKRGEVRWIATAAGRRLWSAGMAMSVRPNGRIAPELHADIFERSADRYGIEKDGLGFRLELGLRRPVSFSGQRADIGFRIGYKTRGYLNDAPRRETVLGGISISFRM